MADHEKYVRDRWDSAECLGLDGARFVSINRDLWMVPGNHRTDGPAWAAAYAFTIEREKQIAEVEEEIALLLNLRIHASELDVAQRIRVRLEAVLADLQRGMKEK